MTNHQTFLRGVLVVFSLFFVVSAQAETTTERLEREIEESRATLKASCDTIPKKYRIKREEYGTLTEEERRDRQKALNKEMSRDLSELEVKGEELSALSLKMALTTNEIENLPFGSDMTNSERYIRKRRLEALREKGDELFREADRLEAEMDPILEKSKRAEAEWCFLEFVMGK